MSLLTGRGQQSDSVYKQHCLPEIEVKFDETLLDAAPPPPKLLLELLEL